MAKTIRRASHAGFCFGVTEAIRKAEQIIQENQAEQIKIYSCGPLIHNKSVTDDLSKQGITIVERIEDAEVGSKLIIRSHGEPADFYRKAVDRHLTVIDATCPFVSRIHKIVREASAAGRDIVVIGDAKHPEVMGIVGWTGSRAYIIDSLEMAKTIPDEPLTVVAQTTITGELWDCITSYLKNERKDVVTLRTICNATRDRQSSCEELAKESDLMIVIGDWNSSNSKKLFEIAQRNCKKTYFVENINDLPLKDIEICDKIGVAAGASTPERIIKEVIATMSELITEKEELQETETVEAAKEAPEQVKETPTVKVKTLKAKVEEEDDEVNMMHDFMDQIDKALKLPNRGDIIDGEIVHVSDREIVVNLGYKKDGVIPKDELVLESDQELTELYKEGQMIQAKVIKTDDGDGNILLSRKKLEVNEHWDEINEALDNKTVVNAKVIKEVKGGVIAVYKEVSGFIPMSQLSDKFVEKADEFIGKILPVKVSRVDQKRNKAVFSHKAYLAESKQKKVQEIWDSLKVGDVVDGTVMRFTEYGAFVDIGGLDGLLHISEISWGKLKHPQEALAIGDKIKVKILSMNTEKGKISLGMKQNMPEPWTIIENQYQIDQVIEGKVVQIKEYGAFVELEPGLDGLVHISEIAHKRVTNIADELTVGETVQAKILDIDRERKRISLSIKETLEPSLMGDDEAEPVLEQVEEDEE